MRDLPIDLPDDGWAMTGRRARGGDQSRRFVDVLSATVPFTPDGLATIADAVVPAYDAYRPRCLRVYVAEPDTLVSGLASDPRFTPGCEVDQYVVAGAVVDLRARVRASTFDRVGLVPGDPETLAERSAAVYAAIARLEPELAEWATPEDMESLAACASEGLLFEGLVDDTPAGVVAAIRSDEHGLTGFAVRELCLSPEFRGARLAPAVLQRLVDALPDRPGDLLWGTIHPGNQPSLRSALAVGRSVVGGYVWVAPLGLPG